MVPLLLEEKQVYQGEGWLILSRAGSWGRSSPSVSRGGVVDSQPMESVSWDPNKCIKGRGG